MMTAKRQSRRAKTVVTTLLMTLSATAAPVHAQPAAGRVIVVTLDGMRWQEVFNGADRDLIVGPNGGVGDTSFTLERFWRPSRDGRREALFPFLSGVVGRRGTLIGDSASGSIARVTNGKQFSYPGYNELFSGQADDRIDSNAKVPNPNVTVLEWLVGKPGFKSKVEVYGSWDVFPSIFNVDRSKLPVNGGGPPFPAARTEREKLQNRMATWMPNHWKGVRLDAPTMAAAMEALRTRQPRVLAVLLGETDEWAHERRYDLYLDAAHRADQFIAQLWEAAQALPAYRGRTTLLVATDHGRGPARDWTDHGREMAVAGRIWIGLYGPRILPLGVDSRIMATQSQFAATIAKAVGEQWQTARVGAAPPIDAAFKAH